MKTESKQRIKQRIEVHANLPEGMEMKAFLVKLSSLGYDIIEVDECGKRVKVLDIGEGSNG